MQINLRRVPFLFPLSFIYPIDISDPYLKDTPDLL